jgi:hypothetical protein
LRRAADTVLKSELSMQVHGPGFCSCHAPSPAPTGAAPSTGFFVLFLSLTLVLVGLVVQGVIPLRFW